MTRQRQDRLVDLLVRSGTWRTAADLADRLGVTTRSIRSYVAAVNERVGGTEAIESGAMGYRVRPDRLAAIRDTADENVPDVRRHAIGRTIVLADDGVDVYALADEHFVSEGTIESDLAWVRARGVERGLRWERRGPLVGFVGEEGARRATLRSLLLADTPGGFDEAVVEGLLGTGSVDRSRVLRARLSAQLTAGGYFVNEFALGGVAFAVLLAAWRSSAGALIEPVGDAVVDPAARQVVDEVIREVLGAALPAAEVDALTVLLRVRGAVASGSPSDDTDDDAAIAGELRRIVDAVTERFAVPALEDDVLTRLVAHVQNLRRRSSGGEWSRNPLTRTLKASYPLLFDVAVALASALYERFGIPVHDDEVAYLAMHIGGQWERRRSLENRLTATLVCPGYYEMHELLRTGIEQSLGSVLMITDVHTDAEPSGGFDTDLVLTTLESGQNADNVVQISPFFTDVDAERVMAAVARIRRSRRLSQFRAELSRYFVPAAFVRGIEAGADEESVIRRLGALLVAEGVIDEEYVESTVVRERTSSTAFTETLAVPHAIGMTATRTAIAIGIAESTLPWGDARVQVVAMVAFSETDREAFQTVFEQFVEVFSDAASVQRLVRRGTDFPAFLEQLAALIDG